MEAAEERLGRCDPHIHTTYSDGLGSPREVVERAMALGLDVIAITDHDSVQGALEARELAARAGYPLDVIVGSEVTTARGVHLLALFVEERLPMLRPAARIHPKIRPVPDLFPGACLAGRDSGYHEIELVIC